MGQRQDGLHRYQLRRSPRSTENKAIDLLLWLLPS